MDIIAFNNNVNITCLILITCKYKKYILNMNDNLPIIFDIFLMIKHIHTEDDGDSSPASRNHRNSLHTKKEAEASFDTVVSDYSANSASTFAAFGAFATGAGFSSLTTGAVTTAVGAPSPTIRFSSVV